MATAASAAGPPGRENAYMVAVSRAVWRHPEHHVRGVLEGPGRSTAAVQRRGVDRMSAGGGNGACLACDTHGDGI